MRRRRRNRIAIGGAGAVALVLLLAAAAWHDIRQAHAQLEPAVATLQDVAADGSRLRTRDGRAETNRAVGAAVDRLEAARSRIDASMPLRFLGWLPGLGRQRAGALELLDDAATVGAQAVRFLQSTEALGTEAPVEGAKIPVDRLDTLGRMSADTGRALVASVRSSSGLWGSLGNARRDYNQAVGDVGRRLLAASRTIHATTSFLGAKGPRKYFLAVENNAEMRARPMTLSYGVVEASGGRLDFSKTGSVNEIQPRSPVPFVLPSGTEKVFGDLGMRTVWQNTTASPDFDLTSRLQLAMWEHAGGEPLAGVIAVDVPGLAALLGSTGPVEVPGIAEPLTAENVGRVLLHDLYEAFPPYSQGPRREKLGEVAGAVVAAMRERSLDPLPLADALGSAAAGGHLRLWSREADETAAFVAAGLSGGPQSAAPERTFHVAVENATTTKLDYYVRPSVSMEIVLTPADAAVVRTTVTLVNSAPAGAAPSYQLGPQAGVTSEPGEYVARVYLWGPSGAEQLDSVEESGLRLNGTVARVGPGGSTALTFSTVIPNAVKNGELRLHLVPQPRLDPALLSMRLTAPGRTVTGGELVDVVWDRPIDPIWKIR